MDIPELSVYNFGLAFILKLMVSPELRPYAIREEAVSVQYRLKCNFVFLSTFRQKIPGCISDRVLQESKFEKTICLNSLRKQSTNLCIAILPKNPLNTIHPVHKNRFEICRDYGANI